MAPTADASFGRALGGTVSTSPSTAPASISWGSATESKLATNCRAIDCWFGSDHTPDSGSEKSAPLATGSGVLKTTLTEPGPGSTNKSEVILFWPMRSRAITFTVSAICFTNSPNAVALAAWPTISRCLSNAGPFHQRGEIAPLAQSARSGHPLERLRPEKRSQDRLRAATWSRSKGIPEALLLLFRRLGWRHLVTST